MDDGDNDSNGVHGGRRVEIRDAAGGGIRVLLVCTNLSKMVFLKRPVVFDNDGNLQGINNRTFELVFFPTNFSKPGYSPLISHSLPFALIIFFPHMQPLE